jgi:hypothetical protein
MRRAVSAVLSDLEEAMVSKNGERTLGTKGRRYERKETERHRKTQTRIFQQTPPKDSIFQDLPQSKMRRRGPM